MLSGAANVPDNGVTATNVEVPKEPAKIDRDGNLGEQLYTFSGFFDSSFLPFGNRVSLSESLALSCDRAWRRQKTHFCWRSQCF